MSGEIRATLLIVGGLGFLYTLAWALDFRSLSTSQLTFWYRLWGSWIWPGGSERSYVRSTTHAGWFGVVICGVMFGKGLWGS